MNTVVLSENALIAVGVIGVVLLGMIIYTLNLITKLLGLNSQTPSQSVQPVSNVSPQTMDYEPQFDDDDSEERLVAALAASALAAQDKPNSRFHIKKITRIQ